MNKVTVLYYMTDRKYYSHAGEVFSDTPTAEHTTTFELVILL